MNSGRFIYLGYVVCLIDSRYIDAEITEDGVKLILSDYARNHANECCLKFLHNSRVYNDDFSFQGQIYLSQRENKNINEYIPSISDELKVSVEIFDKEESLIMPSFGETLQHFLFGSEIEVRKDNGDFTREAITIIDDFVANMSLSNTIT